MVCPEINTIVMEKQAPVKQLYIHPKETYEIESESLEAHVAICSERYYAIHQHIQDTEVRVCERIDYNSAAISRLERIFFWGLGATFVTLLGGVVATLLK